MRTTPVTGRSFVPLLFVVALVLAMTPVTAMAQDDDPENWDNFTQEVLNDEVQEAMALAVLPDGRVLHNARSGDPDDEEIDAPAPFRLYDPESGESPIIAELPVYSFSEFGAQGMALDPDFEDNGWIYVYYTPDQDVPEGEAPYDGDDSEFEEFEGVNHLSRFEFVDGDEPTIDFDSEEVVLEVPVDLGLCCHVGGDIDFDADGNLYLTTGDDTSPFESDDYTPIDEREGRHWGFDAQRTSANTADLRGKVLRITPEDDGSYSVPDDNMFNSGEYDDLFPDGEYDEELALPEIYAMGLRNPFRFAVDQETGILYLGDYGPDAGEEDPERGPDATVSWHIIDEPRNAGWPYCIGNNFPFVEYDFETEESGEPFDCDNPVNDSPHNTGLEELPPTTPAEVWDHNNRATDEFPELGEGGGAPMGGPVYRYDDSVDAVGQFPEAYDGVAFFYEWNENYLKQFHLSDDGTELESIEDFVPDWEFAAPMDMEFGPDGALYLLEYGGGFFVEADEARLSRIAFDPDADEPGQPMPPQPVTAVLDPEEPDGEDGAYASEVTLDFDAQDDIAETQYRLAGDEDWEAFSEPVVFDEDGEYTVEYRGLFEGNGGEAQEDEGQDAEAQEGDGQENAGDVDSEVHVEATNFEFTPDEFAIEQGGTIEFENVQGAHNVIITDEDGNQVESEERIGGWDTFEFEADEPGVFTFDCTPHDGMDGQFEVVAEGEAPGGEADAEEDETVTDVYEVEFEIALDADVDDGAVEDDDPAEDPDTEDAADDGGIPGWLIAVIAAVAVIAALAVGIKSRGNKTGDAS